MNRSSILLLILVILAVLPRCGTDPLSPLTGGGGVTQAEMRLVESDNKFGLKVFREMVSQGSPDSSVLISPLSISMALGMTFNGAAGSTEQAMRTTLEYETQTLDEINGASRDLVQRLTGLDPSVVFDTANSIWYLESYSFEEAFMNRCMAFFGAEIRGVNFCDAGVPSLINGWVREHTNGRIEEMVDDPIPDCGDLVMMLMNAIYFKGGWTHPFDPENTYDTWFNLPDGSRKPCRMMGQTWKYDYFENDLFKAVDLPYGDSTFTMTILFPGRKVELDELIRQLTPSNWDGWMSSFSKDSVDVYLPRFTLEYENEMKDVLSSLGMSIAFSGGADFTRMYRPGGLFISRVKHKTFLQVDEKGAEGSAATEVDVSQSNGLSIYVDEPFVFAIREKSTNTLLFIAKVVDAIFI